MTPKQSKIMEGYALDASWSFDVRRGYRGNLRFYLDLDLYLGGEHAFRIPGFGPVRLGISNSDSSYYMIDLENKSPLDLFSKSIM